MMEIKVFRYNHKDDFTIGLLMIDGEFECYTLEDEIRTKKVWGETAIPAGKYEIKFRTVGENHQRYSKRYGEKHHGMLELQDVPNFEFILIHIGNDDDDTAGCILVGETAGTTTIGSSRIAYEKMYEKVAKALLNKERVTIEIITLS